MRKFLLALFMPKKADKVFEVLDILFTKMNMEEAQKMWFLLTILRGPDLLPPTENIFTIKRATTGLIRTVLFPRVYAKKEYMRIIHFKPNNKDFPMMSQNVSGMFEDMVEAMDMMWARSEWNHFREHMIHAIGAHPELQKSYSAAFNRVMKYQQEKLQKNKINENNQSHHNV